jgi:hypothetical protein
MSFSGPILEKWLLSGEAVHKNLSLGGGGLTQIRVPEGKTYIITKIEILPFFNVITENGDFADAATFGQIQTQNLEPMLQRLQFQLMFYQPRGNSVYNIRNKFVVQTYEGNGSVTHTAPGLQFEKHSFDCFHVVEDTSWLFLKYIDFFSGQPTLNTDFYQFIFDGSQNWDPTQFYGYLDQSDISGFDFIYGGNSYLYNPQGYYNFAQGQNQFILPTAPYPANTDQTTSFIPPYGPQTTQGNLKATDLPSIPFYNISVIEINRRLSTSGLLDK